MSRHRRWTEDEEIYLAYYLYEGEERNYNAAAEFLGRSIEAVKNKAKRMRALGDENIGFICKPFSDYEINYIKNNYKTMPVKLMSEHLGRPEYSIINKANRSGLTKQTSLKDYDTEIRELAAKGFWKSKIARALSLNIRSVTRYITDNKIQCKIATKEEQGKYYRKLGSKRYTKNK